MTDGNQRELTAEEWNVEFLGYTFTHSCPHPHCDLPPDSEA